MENFQTDMAAEPDFCRDILETRIKGILKEHLKISRDISFLQAQDFPAFSFYLNSPYCFVCRSEELTLVR